MDDRLREKIKKLDEGRIEETKKMKNREKRRQHDRKEK